ncbi:MAG: hypothetical protein SVK08_07245 [Halobacteriota archaeon]|nr:hypothetical protein [Halobacteriota archaeon]
MKVKETKVLQETEVGSVTNGTNLKGYLHGYTFTDLVKLLGDPTYDTPSGDDKVQKEWVIRFDTGSTYEYATIYDWKTYDLEYTTQELTTWNIGAHVPMVAMWVKDFLDQAFVEYSIRDLHE